VWLTPIANALLSFLAFVLGQAARPVFWLVDRLGIDPDRVREFFERLRRSRFGDVAQDQVRGSAALWQRTLGLLMFVGIGFAIYRAIRRFRPEAGGPRPAHRPPGTATERSLTEDASAPVRPRLRREPPADRVRRWYTEALEILGRRGCAKAPWQTPAEFEPEVAGAFPTVAGEFAALTRAYEDVRYGSLHVDRPGLDRLEGGQHASSRDPGRSVPTDRYHPRLMTDVVVVEGLAKRFGEVEALRGIDLSVAPGSVFGLLGPNGAGKTTAIRILTTLLHPDGGHATVAGYDVVKDAERLRHVIGLAGQSAAVDENLTGLENLEMVGACTVDPAEARRRADGPRRFEAHRRRRPPRRDLLGRHAARPQASLVGHLRSCSWTSQPPGWTHGVAARCGT
jgi:ABC-type multidrug transport system fused ATPase/permease subunit